jgi:heavy metal translocating P-type ATPase
MGAFPDGSKEFRRHSGAGSPVERSQEVPTPDNPSQRALRAAVIPAAAVAFAVAGAALRLTSTNPRWGDATWMAGLLIAGAPVVWRTIARVAGGHFATDIVAMLAIVTAVALRQPLAGLIVVLMQTGGEALERFAEGRASQAVRRLEEDAPRVAHRVTRRGTEDVAVDEIAVDDSLLVRPGEMIPCDGQVSDGRSHVDTSRLTGEPLPLTASAGTRLLSGMLNGEGPLVMRATALSRESQYARIVELVRSAEASKSPLQRLADRYAIWFTPITLVVCGASWLLSGDATRALAVLVVATPCPLILATPIAIIGGINRAAARQIIMRTGGAMERLDRVRVAIFDKTGTITIGRPDVSRVRVVPPHDEREVLRLAGALEQQSGHLLARSVVEAAERLGGILPSATDARESAGRGISGTVEGRRVSVGALGFIRESLEGGSVPEAMDADGTGLRAYVAIDGAVAGALDYADRIRPGASELLDRLRDLGVRRTLLLSGDSETNARAVARSVGIHEVRGDLLPADKVAEVAELAAREGHVLMVGDGTNDAPALSRADVGIALAGHGGGITAEAADVVILIDDLARVGDAIAISRRTMRIARQSIWVGLTLSGTAMIFAAAGTIAPVLGAVLQEVIDVAVIVNALRASFGAPTVGGRMLPGAR